LFNSQIVPYFKNKRVEDIEPIDIKNFFQRFKSKSSLYVCSNAILKPAFENAILEKYIKYSPMQIDTPIFKIK
jgi:integrase